MNSSVSDLITRSLKEKYKSDVIEEGVLIDIENIDKTNILTEENINNLSSALLTGIVVSDIVSNYKLKRNTKNR